MSTATLFTIAKIWNQHKNPSIDGWIKKTWAVCMSFLSATKKNETLLLATTWMDLEGIMLSEIGQTKTNTT